MKADDIRTVVALARLGFGPEDIRTLARLSVSLRHIAERECNGDGWGPGERLPDGRWFPRWTDDDQERADKRTAALLKLAQAVCDGAGRNLKAYHQGDPRGCALYIVRMDALGTRDINANYSSFGVAV